MIIIIIIGYYYYNILLLLLLYFFRAQAFGEALRKDRDGSAEKETVIQNGIENKLCTVLDL